MRNNSGLDEFVHREGLLVTKKSRTDEKIVIEKLMSRGRSTFLCQRDYEKHGQKETYPSIFDQLKNCKKNSKLSPSTSTIIKMLQTIPG